MPRRGKRTRTNIEIDDDAVAAVMERYHLPTKTDAVNAALRCLAGQPMSRDEIESMYGAHAIGRTPRDRRPRR